jgi:5'-nucleotidase (lipoprotein e(P4) family)
MHSNDRKKKVMSPSAKSVVLLAATLLGACSLFSPTPPSQQDAVTAVEPRAPAAAVVTLNSALHWYRDSAEQRAIYWQTFRAAAVAARTASAGLAPRSWGVILDVDETLLDNSQYEKQLNGAAMSLPTWNAWVRERAAVALPGAREFTQVIHDLQGQVVLVTNRGAAQCADTEANLQAVGIAYDRILCDAVGDGDKNPRFRQVQDAGGVAPLKVVLWVGDNIRDFPDLSQSNPGDPALFGVRYFVLPNPIYGSWEKNAAR